MKKVDPFVLSFFVAVTIAGVLSSCSQSHFIGPGKFYGDGVSLHLTETGFSYMTGEGLSLNEYSYGGWQFIQPNKLLLNCDVTDSRKLISVISSTPSDTNFSMLCVVADVPMLDFDETKSRYVRVEMIVNGRRFAVLDSENSFFVMPGRVETISFKAYYFGMSNPSNAEDTLYSGTITANEDDKYHNYLIRLNCHYFEFFKRKIPSDTLKILSPTKLYWQRKGVKLYRRRTI